MATRKAPARTLHRPPTPSERGVAIERAVHQGVIVGPPARRATLDKPGRALLAEALRRADEVRSAVENALVGYGRWLLVNVFADDAGAALGARSANPVWAELLARAGGPTLRMSRKMLYVALAIAARDKHINDESWRLLEPGRKELLLPLPDERAMRKAAQHVVAMKLSHRATRDYVRALRRADGDVAHIRMTPQRAQRVVERLVDALGDAHFRARLGTQLGALPRRERDALRRRVVELRASLRELLEPLGA